MSEETAAELYEKRKQELLSSFQKYRNEKSFINNSFLESDNI